jgi:hypothetical protein
MASLPRTYLLVACLFSLGAGCIPDRGTMPRFTWRPGEPETKCTKSQRNGMKPWRVRDRDALEAALARGAPVVVSALGCQADILAHCHVPGGYDVSTKRWDLDRDHVAAQELWGDCAGATHVIRTAAIGRGGELSVELDALSLGAYDLTGTWRGTMRQPDGPYEVYDLLVDLEQRGDRLSGTSYLSTTDSAYWGVLRFEGRIEGNTLFFADAELVDDNLGIFLDWCRKGGYLLVDPRHDDLRGPWRAFGCFPGSVELSRR